MKDAKQAGGDLGLLRDEGEAIEQGVDVEETRAARRAALAAETRSVFHAHAQVRASHVGRPARAGESYRL